MRRLITVMLAFGMISIIQTRDAVTQTSGVCPALVQNALRQVETHCAGTGRNQICYGHSVLLAEPRPEITDVSLSTPGDVTEIYNISRLQLFPMDIDLGAWGVALMRVQANLPDALPGQNVLFLLFGDVELTPETSTELVSNQSEDETPEPISAFRLRSGIGTPFCDDAPPDGLLIQTPHGVGRVELTINGVDVSLGSTVFFTAQENEYLTVSTLEGAALIRTEDGESIALAGSQVQIPLDEDLVASAPPMLPQPYDAEVLNALPLQALDRPVEVAPPLTEQQIEVIHAVIEDGNAQSLLPENTPTMTPTPECAECVTPPSRTPTDSSAQAEGAGVETNIPRTSARTPNSPASTTPPTSRPTNPPTEPPPPTNPPTQPPTLRPTNPPTEPPTSHPTNPPTEPPPTNPPPTAPPPTEPPPPTDPPPTEPPPPTNCPGQSCNAPGHGGSCPGNSCNAPGQNKRLAANILSYEKLPN